MKINADTLGHIFKYHAPFGDQATRYQEIREAGGYLAQIITNLAPESEERTLALRKIQEAVMWANASIAINETNQNQTGPS